MSKEIYLILKQKHGAVQTVADLANCSRVTVSKVLNHGFQSANELNLKIHEVAKSVAKDILLGQSEDLKQMIKRRQVQLDQVKNNLSRFDHAN
jgi:hypothetical protein